MIPIPDEITLWIGILLQILPFLLVTILGLYTADVVADKKKAKEENDPNAYDLDWKEVILYGIGASVLTLTIIKDPTIDVWGSAAIAWSMGLVFRILLPKIIALAEVKLDAIIQAVLFK